MSETLLLLTWPLVACLALPWLLVYYGLHIIKRGIIFVDLALAQVAALGTAFSIYAGYDAHDWQTFVISLTFTFLGSALLALTGRSSRVPQEALIGIIYIVCAAAGIVVLSGSPSGKEELQRSLVGELLIVSKHEVLTAFVIFLAIGLVHFFLRKTFLLISLNPASAVSQNIRVAAWDFLFYALFGVVVTTFVHMGGVLLTFSFLIIPAVAGLYCSFGFRAQLLAGWALATLSSIASLLLSVRFDLPIGATTVCVLALFLVILSLILRLRGGTRLPEVST